LEEEKKKNREQATTARLRYDMIRAGKAREFRSRSKTLTRVPKRADDKTAEEYALEGGATLHLVLALRGGGAAC